MKRFISALALAAFSTLAFATTLTPIQSLNPVGSTAGQVIGSTGPTSAPSWQTLVNSVIAGSGITVSSATGNVTLSLASGAIPLTSLPQIPANSVLGNPTGATANVTTVSIPSCSAGTNALTWTSASGFACNTAINATTLGGATFAAPGAIGATTASTGKFTTLQATGAITPSSTAGIVGTALADNANAGSIGEYLESVQTTAGSITQAATTSTVNLVLTPGDWDVEGTAYFAPVGSATITRCFTGISKQSTAFDGPAPPFYQDNTFTGAGGTAQAQMAPERRISVAVNTQVWLLVNASSSGSTVNFQGYIRARRAR